MTKGFSRPLKATREPVRSYAPGTPEREAISCELEAMRSTVKEIPMYIGGEEVFTDDKRPVSPPHDHHHVIGHYHYGDEGHVKQAVDAALGAKHAWERLSWEHRAAIFLKAADLIAGPYRYKINAATMLGQSKTVHQAEIEAACEQADFFRHNVEYMTEIYAMQPESSPGIWNRLEHRPLEGFVLAISPFNFTAIASNLPCAPALMGNTCVWKPTESQIYSAQVIMEALIEAGLPDGVINLIYAEGPTVSDICLAHPDFAGLHFTGSTPTFKHLWKKIAENLDTYKTFPRIVGETGGKDFVLAHKSAKPRELAIALLRGAFEYQGQKCSAASRAYIPANLWDEVRDIMVEELKGMKQGPPEDFSNFLAAVIDRKSFDKIKGYIDEAKKSPLVEVVAGGGYDDSKGYFVEPTVLRVEDNQYRTMQEEIFGPVLTVFVYNPEHFEEAIYMVDNTSPYALTGAIFSQDRYAIELATEKLMHAAGNFYINDKPTGAIVGEQPFGGARLSGTNDKAGSIMNLLRWTSARTVKENFVPPVDYRYPYMG